MVGKKENGIAVYLKQCSNANEGDSIIPTFGCPPPSIPYTSFGMGRSANRRINAMLMCIVIVLLYKFFNSR